MLLKLITAPLVEPVTLAELNDVARAATADDNNQLERLIKAARIQVESFLETALITQTWELTLPCFPGDQIELPYPPLQSVTSVKYYDGTNVQQTLSATWYNVIVAGEPGKIELKYGYSWPTVYSRSDAIVVKFVAGYGDTAATVPQDIIEEVKNLATHLYDHPEEAVVGTIFTRTGMFERMLWPRRHVRI